MFPVIEADVFKRFALLHYLETSIYFEIVSVLALQLLFHASIIFVKFDNKNLISSIPI